MRQPTILRVLAVLIGVGALVVSFAFGWFAESVRPRDVPVLARVVVEMLIGFACGWYGGDAIKWLWRRADDVERDRR